MTHDRVVEAAEVLADEVGIAGLSFAALADRLGVKVPSLYKHVASLDAVRQSISVRAKNDMADAIGAAAIGRSRGEAVRALSLAYRAWAGAHPGRYETTLRAAIPGDPADVRAGSRAVEVIFSALAGYDLSREATIDATRMLRSTLHGFVALEAAGGFMLPLDVDASFESILGALDRTFDGWDPAGREPGREPNAIV
ncbi:TetR/AcrR family transcriptional regulator [Conyzicola nivalis]|uniref:TetR family transcriptional regulator n=1 Tax=Conyzicola nivalis TaxID=1477021 RepID=A0A916WHM4_9MICO|nr:TetR family transcriptional regulator [Conyzicola nivalis]